MMQKKTIRIINDIGVRVGKDIRDYWGAAAALLVYTVLLDHIFDAFCPMVIIFGLPCPGCGLTRSVLYLASGQIYRSIWINPMGIPIVGILIYFFWNRYIIGRKAKWIVPLIIIAIVLLVILYIWRMYAFFPDRVPYVYTPDNVLSQNSAFYEQMLHYLRIL